MATGLMVDTVLPPQTLLSLGDDPVSKRLWQDVTFLDEPCCQICGYPFEYETTLVSLCAACSTRAPQYSSARSALQYDDGSRSLILGFKHGGRTEALSMFAAQMRRAGRRKLKDADYIIPVPLHMNRLVKRRYNQSALLGRALSKISSPAFSPDMLMRVRATSSQGGKSMSARRRNVKGAFAIRESAKVKLKGANIILVDDVMTTGATIEACAQVLFHAGAGEVNGLCLARVVRPQKLPT
ncbi:MAG: ComF family protein [Litorimonas sp.]